MALALPGAEEARASFQGGKSGWRSGCLLGEGQVRGALQKGTLTQAQSATRFARAEKKLASLRRMMADLQKEKPDLNWSQAPPFIRLERQAQEWEAERDELRWLCQMLGSFETLWEGLNEDNQRRLLRLVVQVVAVDEAKDNLRVVFVDLEATA